MKHKIVVENPTEELLLTISNVGELLHADAQVVTQTVVMTDNGLFADAVNAILCAYSLREELPVTQLAEPRTVPAKTSSATVEPVTPMAAEGTAPHGLIAANLKEKSAVCQHCGHSFIRRAPQQRYCKSPECERARWRDAKKAKEQS